MVVGKKVSRKDKRVRKIESFFFFLALEKFTGLKISHGIGNFGIYQRKVIDSFLKLGEEFRSFGVQIAWLGFKRYEQEIESEKRLEGKSSYSFSNKLKFAINTIISFSSRLLYTIIIIGFLIFLAAFVLLLFKIINTWIKGNTLVGWSSIILSIYISLGLVITVIGFVGLYIGKIFSEVKKRPIYISSEKLGF